MEQRIGVIGVDYILAHVVEGLFHGGGRPRITLGPRNREWCEHLCRLLRVSSARSEQQVIDASDLLLLRLDEHTLEHDARGFRFRDDQLVIGVGMDVPQRRLARAVHPAQAVRATLLCAAAVGEAAVCLYPAERRAERLLASLGEVHHLRDESHFDACTAVFAGYQFLLTLSAQTDSWLRDQGLPDTVAAALAARLPRAAGAMAGSRHENAAEQAAALAAADRVTALGASVLQRARMTQQWRRALDVMLAARRRDKGGRG